MTTPRPVIDVENTEEDEAVTLARASWLAAVIPKMTQRERALINTFRYIQFRRLFLSPIVLKNNIREEMTDPDPYDPLYVFYCPSLRLTNNST